MNITDARSELLDWVARCKTNDIDYLDIMTSLGFLQKSAIQNKPTPCAFKDMDEFGEAVITAKQDLKKFLDHKIPDIGLIVKSSVAGNTFRAFHMKSRGLAPSELYRSTVTKIFIRDLALFKGLNTQEAYTKFVVTRAKEIGTVFDESMGKDGFMGFNRASKLLNLTCKEMLRFSGFDREVQRNLLPLLHVPWDSFTLQAVRLLKPPYPIPMNASMGWEKLNDEETYLMFQAWIRAECDKLNAYPIHYEIAAWNMAH